MAGLGAGLIVLISLLLGLYVARPVEEPAVPKPRPTPEIEASAVPSSAPPELAPPDEEITPELHELMTRGLPIEGCDASRSVLDGVESEQDFKRITRDAVDALSATEDPEYLLAAALMDIDRDDKAESLLLTRAMAQLPNHPVALWHRLQHCRNEGCNRAEIAQAAVAADPTNGLLWLEIAGGHIRDGNRPEAERALRRAIASSRFDTYFIDYAELIERGLAASTDFDYRERIVFGIGVAAAVAIPAFGDVSRACRSEENDAVVWVPLCEALGSSMNERSSELVSTMMGWGFRRVAAERAGDGALAQELKERSQQLREQYLERQFSTGADVLMENDPMVLRQYVDDFRAHGELRAIDRLVEVAERLREDETYDQCNFVKSAYEPS